jgi:hypothetical protein
VTLHGRLHAQVPCGLDLECRAEHLLDVSGDTPFPPHAAVSGDARGEFVREEAAVSRDPLEERMEAGDGIGEESIGDVTAASAASTRSAPTAPIRSPTTRVATGSPEARRRSWRA